MGSKKMQVWLPLLLAGLMVVGMLIGYQLRDKTAGVRFFGTQRRGSIQEAIDIITNKYVDPVKGDSLTNLAMEELLGNLDPHSVYIPPADLKDFNEELMGNFQGIGVEFQQFHDTVHVLNVIKGGPSEKAGLKVGDRLVKVNDSISLVKIDPDQVRKYLRGPGGSLVKVGFVRNGKLNAVNITRGTIPVSSIDAAYIVSPGIGFIRINKFAERTYEEFMSNLERLQKAGMQQLILDLRGNGGGLMNEATDIADEFLDGDKLIVYTQGDKVSRYDYRCQKEGLFEKGKLVVLIDETSASASEVLTGALQDWDRATIIGRRSFGKGLVQQQFQLSDGSAMRLTIARYYTPLGRNIQKPYEQGKEKYQEELAERFHNGEVLKADSIKQKGKAYKTPAGRTVYGGGGITPDVFVPLDTTSLDAPAMRFYRRNTMVNFVYEYYTKHQGFFAQFKDPLAMAGGFVPGEQEWTALKGFAARDSIAMDAVSAKDKQVLLKRMQALMARQIWRNEGYFEIMNRQDMAVQKALQVLQAKN